MKPNSSLLAISLQHIYKKYIIHHEKPILIERLKLKKTDTFFALKNINLTIKKGERIGIIGNNGSGKTTLLKIIAGISTQTKGKIKTSGRVVSIIDVNAGFHPDLNGEKNVFLNGLLLGMSKAEVACKFDDIVKFSGIGQFIDTPLSTYSEGMKLRLGLSIAVYSNPDILLLDEGLNIGDRKFQIKLQSKMKEFYKLEKTIINVSHSMDFIQRNCTKIIIMDKGKITHTGAKQLLYKYRAGKI